MATGMLAEGVQTLTLGSRINNVRIYGDTLFAATDASVQWVNLNDTRQSGGDVLCVVVYDYLRSGAKRLDVYTDDARYQQHPLCPDKIYRSEQLPDGQMGYTLSRSADFGQTWWTTGLKALQLPGRPQIAFNPLDANEMYLFGMNEYVDCIDGQSWVMFAEIDLPLYLTGTTTGLRGLQCHLGQLVCWADDHVYLIDTARQPGYVISNLDPADRLQPVSTPAYDLAGRPSGAAPSPGIIIRDGRKIAVK